MTRLARVVAATAAALILAPLAGCDNDPLGTSCQEFLKLPTSRQFQIAKQWARPDPADREGPPWTSVKAAQELTAACRDDPTKIVAEIGVAWFGRDR